MLTEKLGYDAAINYRTDDVPAKIRESCPDGVDVFFDNVGGEILDHALGALNRYGRVVFNNGCVVYFNASGQRFQNLPSCDGRQIRRADDAMARYRREQGQDGPSDEHPWARPRPSGGWGDDTPEIMSGTNRESEVIFRNNCVVYYTANGRRWKQQPSCMPDQVRRADDAMARHRREQGW